MNILLQKMKRIAYVVSFCLLTHGIQAQERLQILIVGSAHQNADSADYFRQVIDRLKRFQPDAVFGEYLSAEDLRELEPNNYGRTSYQKKYDYLSPRNPQPGIKSRRRALAALKALDGFAYLHKARIDLALYDLLTGDTGNGMYQLYVLETYMKSHFGEKELAYYNQHVGTLDSLKKVGLFRAKSEYNQIFFPLLYELGQAVIHPMDCQRHDVPWSKAWAKADSLIKKMEAIAKADSTSEEARTVRLIEEYTSYTEEDKRLFDAHPYEGMNSDRYKTLDAAWNFYGGQAFYGFPGFPTDAIKAMIQQWLLRNEGMCKNIVERASALKAKKVLVGVGASHVKWMEEILSKNPQVELIQYNDLP